MLHSPRAARMLSPSRDLSSRVALERIFSARYLGVQESGGRGRAAASSARKVLIAWSSFLR